MKEVIVNSLQNMQNEVRYGDDNSKSFVIDEPASVGGNDAGPDPYTLLLAALGSCISLTVQMYARRKAWPLERITVRLRQERIHSKDCVDCETSTDGFVHRIERAISFEGNLTDEQRARLHEISLKCPIHRTLTSEIVITEMKD